jgi:hypothetical protein
MRLILVVVALFAAYLVGNRIAHPFIDGDLFWQRQLGEFVLTNHAIPSMLGNDVFSAPGAPWTPHEWLLGIFAAFAMDHNALWALSVLAGIAVFAALMITAFRAKRAGASTMSTLAAMLFAGICLEGPFALRAQVLAWPLLAGLMWALDFDGPEVFWAIPMIVAWANLHASVMLAVPIVWLDGAIFVWQRARSGGGLRAALADRGVRMRLGLCVAAPLATLCTPLGAHLPVYAYDLLNNPIRQYIQEWQPMTGLTTQIVAGFFPLIGLCVYGAVRVWRKRPRDLVLTFFMAIWTVVAVRNIALFAIVAAVAAALAVDSDKGWDDPLAAKRFALVPWLAILIGVPVVGYIAYQGNPMSNTWDPPTKSVAALVATPGEHDLLCTEFSKCAYALGHPNVRVFLDGRADPFPPAIWDGFVTVSAMLPGWPEVLDHFKVNALLVDRDDPIDAALKGMPAWREIPQDDPCCAVFIRRSSKS